MLEQEGGPPRCSSRKIMIPKRTSPSFSKTPWLSAGNEHWLGIRLHFPRVLQEETFDRVSMAIEAFHIRLELFPRPSAPIRITLGFLLLILLGYGHHLHGGRASGEWRKADETFDAHQAANSPRAARTGNPAQPFFARLRGQ